MFYVNCIDVLSIINWRDVQRKYVVNNVDMSSLRAPWQNGPYTNKHFAVSTNTKAQHTKNTKTQQT